MTTPAGDNVAIVTGAARNIGRKWGRRSAVIASDERIGR